MLKFHGHYVQLSVTKRGYEVYPRFLNLCPVLPAVVFGYTRLAVFSLRTLGKVGGFSTKKSTFVGNRVVTAFQNQFYSFHVTRASCLLVALFTFIFYVLFQHVIKYIMFTKEAGDLGSDEW
jgi:hypothetical protein